MTCTGTNSPSHSPNKQSTVPLEKLTVVQLVQSPPTSYESCVDKSKPLFLILSHINPVTIIHRCTWFIWVCQNGVINIWTQSMRNTLQKEELHYCCNIKLCDEISMQQGWWEHTWTQFWCRIFPHCKGRLHLTWLVHVNACRNAV